MSLNLRCYLVADPSQCRHHDLFTVVSLAVKAGVTVVQYRDKKASDDVFFYNAKQLKAMLSPRGIPLIINDRLEAAIECDADGLHVGQSDLSWQQARRQLGNTAILGLSIETPFQGEQAQAFAVDYLGAGPIFNTGSKADAAAAWGCKKLAEFCQSNHKPLVAIGGINQENYRKVMQAGVNGIAVISAVCAAKKPDQAIQAMLSGF